MTMMKVYWTEWYSENSSEVCAAEFTGPTRLTRTLAFMESLRKERREGTRDVRFITMVSEDANSVGQAGVDVTGPEYKDQWDKKHRGAGPGQDSR